MAARRRPPVIFRNVRPFFCLGLLFLSPPTRQATGDGAHTDPSATEPVVRSAPKPPPPQTPCRGGRDAPATPVSTSTREPAAHRGGRPSAAATPMMDSDRGGRRPRSKRGRQPAHGARAPAPATVAVACRPPLALPPSGTRYGVEPRPIRDAPLPNRVFRRGDNTPSRVWGREQGGVVSGSPTRSRAVASGAPRHWRRHGQTARSAPAWAGRSPHNSVWGAGVGRWAPRSRRRDGWGPLPAKRPDPPVRADEGGADAPPGSCISAKHPSARRNPPCRAVRGLPRPRARPSGARYSTVVREAPTTLTWRPGEGERGGARRKSRRRPPQRRVV